MTIHPSKIRHKTLIFCILLRQKDIFQLLLFVANADNGIINTGQMSRTIKPYKSHTLTS